MQINVGGLDRSIRIIAGIVMIVLAVTGTVGWWGWLGVVVILTGVVRFCPAYRILGINTCGKK